MPIEPLLPSLPLAALPRLLEVSLVAHRLSVSPRYVRQLIRDKKLPVVRLGQRLRVEAADLQAYVDAQREPSGNGKPGVA